MDLMIGVTRPASGQIILSNPKQKNWEQFDNVAVRLKKVNLPPGNGGKERQSCVVKPVDGGVTVPNPLRRALLQTISTSDCPIRTSEWNTLADLIADKPIAETTFRRLRDELEKDELVEQSGSKWRLTAKGAKELSESGGDQLPILPAASGGGLLAPTAAEMADMATVA